MNEVRKVFYEAKTGKQVSPAEVALMKLKESEIKKISFKRLMYLTEEIDLDITKTTILIVTEIPLELKHTVKQFIEARLQELNFKKLSEKYFNELWETAIPISEAPNGKEVVADFLKNGTQTSLITPYEAYAYILKTYIELHESKKITPYLDRLLEENGFEKYAYQKDAVNQALNVIETYNGVIIADVVGLGKSVIASLIAKIG